MTNKSTKITLDQLIARKTQSEGDKLKLKEVYSEELGGTLTIKKLPLNKFFNIRDQIGQTTEEAFRANCMLVYESCDIFHDSELIKLYNCAEPYDLIPKIFNENLKEIEKIAEEAIKFYGYGSEAGTEIKN